MNNVGVIDQFLETFTRYIDSGFGLVHGDVTFLTTTLIAIDITLAGLFWAWGADEDVMHRLVKKVLYIGFFAFVIGNFNGLARIVFESFAGLGLKAGGSQIDEVTFLQPGHLASTGIDAAQPMLDAANKMMGFTSFFANFVLIAVLMVSWLLVLLAFFILAVQVFVSIIEFKLTTLAGFVLIPFALFNKTSFLAERVLGNVVASGVKILVLAVVVGIGSGLFRQFTNGFAGPVPTISEVLAVLLASLALLGLGIFGPSIANGLISGGPQLGAGSAVGTALAAGGLAAAGDPGVAVELPRVVGRAPFPGWQSRRDRALVRHPDRRPSAAGDARRSEEEPPRGLRHSHQLVEGAGRMIRPHRRRYALTALLISVSACASCATAKKPPVISLDAPPAVAVTPLPDPPKPVEIVAVPTPLPLPGQLKPMPARPVATMEPADPTARVAIANAAARVQPGRSGFVNAIQEYPYSDGALYQVYAAPGQVTDIALQEGETLAGSGPVAAGDTVRWIIGDTTSGAGPLQRVHILLKPIDKDLVTNLVINTDRRTYHLELRATPGTYMASVSWRYPQDQLIALRGQNAIAQAAQPVASGVDLAALNFRYAIDGDNPPWKPLRAFDDGRQVFVEFPAGIGQGEMPPLFVVGPAGGGELVNYRVSGRHMIVDRLFGAAELRMGDKKSSQVVRISRTDGRRK